MLSRLVRPNVIRRFSHYKPKDIRSITFQDSYRRNPASFIMMSCIGAGGVFYWGKMLRMNIY